MFSKHSRMNILQQMRMIYLHIFEETQIENVSSMLDDFHFELTKMSGSFESSHKTWQLQVMSQDSDLPPSLLEDLYGVQVELH